MKLINILCNSGLDDLVQDGITYFSIQFNGAISQDPKYNGLKHSNLENFINIDNDTLDVVLQVPKQVKFTSEPNISSTTYIVLNFQPQEDIDIVISSTDTTEGIVQDEYSTIHFERKHWNVVQTIQVDGVSAIPCLYLT
jgi:hypothetical protein